MSTIDTRKTFRNAGIPDRAKREILNETLNGFKSNWFLIKTNDAKPVLKIAKQVLASTKNSCLLIGSKRPQVLDQLSSKEDRTCLNPHSPATPARLTSPDPRESTFQSSSPSSSSPTTTRKTTKNGQRFFQHRKSANST